jgi:hypothetical protein
MCQRRGRDAVLASQEVCAASRGRNYNDHGRSKRRSFHADALRTVASSAELTGAWLTHSMRIWMTCSIFAQIVPVITGLSRWLAGHCRPAG